MANDQPKRRSIKSSGEKDDSSLDSFLAEHNLLPNKGAPKQSSFFPSDSPTEKVESAEKAKKDEQSPFDPNATVSYESLGEEKPELPFADESVAESPTDKPKTDKVADAVSKTPARSTAQRKSQREKKLLKTDSPQKAEQDPEQIQARSSKPSAQLSSDLSSGRSSKRPAKSSSKSRSSTGASGASQKQAPKEPSRAPKRELLPEANPESYHQTLMHESGYRIRGGGGGRLSSSPIITIIATVIALAAVVIIAWFGFGAAKDFVTGEPPEQIILVTSAETRTALDSELPLLPAALWQDPDDYYNSCIEAGWNIVLVDRKTAKNPDPTALGKEIVHLKAGVSQDILKGYYESEFNTYDFDEMQEYFVGSWMLDLQTGNSGRFCEVKYVNLATDGVLPEMEHLLAIQGLTFQGLPDTNAENYKVYVNGTDDHGNTIMRGSFTNGDVTYYWETIGCPFEDYYGGKDKRTLPDTAVFVRLRVATFDFYGVPATSDYAGDLPTSEDPETDATPEE